MQSEMQLGPELHQRVAHLEGEVKAAEAAAEQQKQQAVAEANRVIEQLQLQVWPTRCR